MQWQVGLTVKILVRSTLQGYSEVKLRDLAKEKFEATSIVNFLAQTEYSALLFNKL